MTACRMCGTESLDQDRFCRHCGASLPNSGGDFVDTARFNPAASPAPNAPTGSRELTTPFYSPPQYGYTVPPGSAPLYQTANVTSNLLRPKFIWPVIILLVSLFVATSLGFYLLAPRSHDERGGMPVTVEESEEDSQSYEEAVQNALGFKQSSFSDAEFPEVRGIFINSLMSDDSPAALAKIQAGDLMMELNNQVVRNNSELSQVLNSLNVGEEVPVKLYRDGEIIKTRIKIGDRSSPPVLPETEMEDQGFLGILDSARRNVPGTKKWGVEIHEFHINGPAELFGLQVGDIITEFNGHPIRTPNEFNRIIRGVKPRTKVKVKFYRGTAEQALEVILGHRW